LLARYVPGGMVDEILKKVAANTVYYHYDALGNVVRLTDNSGNVAEQYTYDVFGAPTIKNTGGTVISSSAFGNRFMFTGREYIQEILLYDYRHRMYSPALGRFLQTDPVGFDAGFNLYRYVGNDPVNLTDPSGLKPTKEGGAAALKAALDIMIKLCECCVEKDKVEQCKEDAKKIVDALVKLWTESFGNGPYGDKGDPVGGSLLLGLGQRVQKRG
jgi:RHS repeat-associated protein